MSGEAEANATTSDDQAFGRLIEAMGGVADVAIVGGGLAGGLLAYRLRTLHPRLAVALIESGTRVGGHHTWSFHQTDISSAASDWLKPLVVKSWQRQRVSFPSLQRSIELGYASIRSERLHSEVIHTLGQGLALGTKVTKIEPNQVSVGQKRLSARAVIDARGWRPEPPPKCGFQKFLGLDVRLERPHGVTEPIIMDAIMPQLEGFRFMYILPWDERRLLVEETYYSDSPRLNAPRIRKSIGAYITRKGWGPFVIEREEDGVLPIPLFDEVGVSSVEGAPCIGASGGFFHSVTGYSLPDTVRLVETIASLADLTTETVRKAVSAYASECLNHQKFYRKLNRLLFRAAEPTLRYQVLERFYGLSQRTIENFYAGRSTRSDQLRILVGKPPVRVGRAIEALRESAPVAEPKV